MFAITGLWMMAITAIDPLYLKLLGVWQGNGYKTNLVTSHKVKLEIEKTYWAENGRVRIRTKTAEIPMDGYDGEPRERVSFHWVKSKDSQSGADGVYLYDFGYGSGEFSPSFASASFDGKTFKIIDQENEDGGNWVSATTYEFLSDTNMLMNASIANGNEKIQKTTVQFKRIHTGQLPENQLAEDSHTVIF